MLTRNFHLSPMLLLIVVMASYTGPVSAAPAAQDQPAAEKSPFLESVQAPAYTSATAHEPMFDNAKLWPGDAKKSNYAQQEWPKSRVLVWAQPGQSAKDGWDVKYWLEDGKPATKPFDENTDLVFPDHGTHYTWVSLTPGRKYQPASFRHLTVGKGNGIIGHFSAGANVWIKAGGQVRFLDSMVGGKNTFVRNDNGDIRLVDHFFINKAPTASVEMIGQFSSDDNWRVNSGILIVGPYSEIRAGNRSDPTVMDKGTLVLLSGSYFTRRSNCDWGSDLVVNGKLMAGLPDRPLTRDARLGLGWKSKGQFMGTQGGGRMPGPNDYGMVVTKGGSITVHTTDPVKTPLAIFCTKDDNDWGQIEIISRNHPLHGDPLIAKLKELPRITDMRIEGEVTWSGILLDDFRKGGIHVKSLPDLSGRTGPTFGDQNQGKPEELFTIIPVTKSEQ